MNLSCNILLILACMLRVCIYGKRYLFYDVFYGEGFNLKRDVYIRIANTVRLLRDPSQIPNFALHDINVKNLTGEDWILVLPPWGPLPHWFNDRSYERYTNHSYFNNWSGIPWSMFFDLNSLSLFIPVMDLIEFQRSNVLDSQQSLLNRSSNHPLTIDLALQLVRGDFNEKLGQYSNVNNRKVDFCPFELRELYRLNDSTLSSSSSFSRPIELFEGSSFNLQNGILPMKASAYDCITGDLEPVHLAPFLIQLIENSEKPITTLYLNSAQSIIHGHWSEWSQEYWTRLEAMDNGKAVELALDDVLFAAQTTRYYAGYADKIHGKQLPVDGNMITFTRREPLGVVACITPWNYPFLLSVLKCTPCLCAGCTVVLKPAEQTPLSALYLAALTKEAGFPPGVFNVICGYGETTGEALTHHPDVRAISFTGSTEVGQLIMKAAATNIKHVKLELGGKSPLIILADADIEKAAEVAHEATMVNHGQCCVAGTRVFVQASIYDQMVEKLKRLAEQRKVGDPFLSDTIQGPQIDNVQFDKIMSYIEKGKKQGARLVTGGCRIGKKGYFIQPTVFADVSDEMCIAKEEIFGPVQCILKFNTLEEVIERANATHYGLGAGVFTSDMDKAMRIAQCVEAGSFWINSYNLISPQTPFGGYKMSGMGRELGKEALDGYLQTKVISMPISVKNS